VADLCAFVNKEFADEWNIDVKNCSFEELLKKAEEIAKDQKSRSFYPVIWGDVPAPDNYWNDSDLMKQLDTYKQIITYQQNVRWQNSVKFFMYVKGEYLTECSDEEILLDTGTTAVRSTYKMVVCKDKYVPVTSNLIGIASWSDNAEEALDFIYRVNTDETIANILQYGVEGENYTLRDGKSVVNYAKPAFGSFGIQNKWITYPQLLEPSNKEDSYKNYIQEHIG
jgi:putative aldouronate transport system substrate-binding protein